MTLMNNEAFALLPTRCFYCDRLFIFEEFGYVRRKVGIEEHIIKNVECLRCKKKRKEINDEMH